MCACVTLVNKRIGILCARVYGCVYVFVTLVNEIETDSLVSSNCVSSYFVIPSHTYLLTFLRCHLTRVANAGVQLVDFLRFRHCFDCENVYYLINVIFRTEKRLPM